MNSIMGLILIFTLLAFNLISEYQETTQHTKIEIENITRLMDEQASTTVQKVELLLREVQRNVYPKDMLGNYGASSSRQMIINSMLKSQIVNLPEIEMVRISNSNGNFVYSSLDSLDAIENISIADRDYFIRQRDNASAGLVISAPLLSRTTNKWTMILSRRINSGNGSFAGIVSIVLNMEYFQQFYHTLNLGPHGVVTLLDKDFRIAARYPLSERDMGNKVNTPIKPYIEKGINYAVIHNKSVVDGIERMNGFRTVRGLPLIVLAGIAEADYLSEWHHHVWQYGVGFLILSMLTIWVTIFQRRSEKEFRIASTAFETQEGMTITDAKSNILRVNQAFTSISGYSSEEVIGKNPRILQSGRHDAAYYAGMWRSINSTGKWEGEVWNKRKNGEVYPGHLTITAVKTPDGIVTNYVANLTDITMSKKAADDIKQLAYYDPLTYLPNRRLLQDRMIQALTASDRSGQNGALLLLDLDNFKTINDTFGHVTGDKLLQEVAERLKSCVRAGDTVARLGGDEFVLVLEDLSKHAIEAAGQAEAIGDKVISALNQTYHLGASCKTIFDENC